MIPGKNETLDDFFDDEECTTLFAAASLLRSSKNTKLAPKSSSSLIDPFQTSSSSVMLTPSDSMTSSSADENSSVEGGDDETSTATMTVDKQRSDKWDVIESSEHAKNTINPIRSIVDMMNIEHNPKKELIRLNIGDPTVCGILPTHPIVCQAIVTSLTSGKYNGYGPAVGFVEARQAVADHVTCPEAPVTADDVVLTSGCSHGLQFAIESLANPGQNILVPRPGFPLYVTLMRPMGIQERFYDLLPQQDWQCDLESMESLIDENTAAIIINNPSNPCGAVYSKQHLEKILRLAEYYRLPIITDEIYGNMVYGGAKFHPLATLRPKVPIITCDGISKRYLVPGWRLGWVIIHDVDGALSEIRHGVRQLAQKIVGPSSLIQGALPSILKNTPPEFFDHTRAVLSTNASLVHQNLSTAPGLTSVRSFGAMYIMIGVDMSAFPDFGSELEFIQKLLVEESVYCLPGSAFNYPGAFRIVLTNRCENILEACQRIRSFCARHFKVSGGKK